MVAAARRQLATNLFFPSFSPPLSLLLALSRPLKPVNVFDESEICWNVESNFSFRSTIVHSSRSEFVFPCPILDYSYVYDKTPLILGKAVNFETSLIVHSKIICR